MRNDEVSAAARQRLEAAEADHKRLGSIAAAAVLKARFGYSYRKIDSVTYRFTGQRASPSSISKLMNRKQGAPRAMPWVEEAAIRAMTPKFPGIAQELLLIELSMRALWAAHQRTARGNNGSKSRKACDAFRVALNKAKLEVARKRHLLAAVEHTKGDDANRELDIASVHFVEGQVHIYEARLSPQQSSGRRLHLISGLDAMLKAYDYLKDAIQAGPAAKDKTKTIHLILAVNALLNAFFVGYEISDFDGDATLDCARGIADKVVAPLFLLAADAVAKWQKDPRVAFNAASAAGLANQHGAAAKRLKLGASIAGFSGEIEAWREDWMLEPLSESAELAEAIKILRKNP